MSLAVHSQPVGIGQAFAAWPSRADRPLPVVLVVSDIWGDGEHLRDLTQRIAASGYLAVAPDLYSGLPSNEALAPDRVAAARAWIDGLDPAVWTDAHARNAALRELGPTGVHLAETLDQLFEGPVDPERFDSILSDAVTFGAAHDAGNHGAVGAVGFCLGGTLVGRLACTDARLGAAIIFYGTPPSREDLVGGGCPVLGLYGGEDHAITDRVPDLADAMAAADRRFESHVYPDAPHAFFNDLRSAYRVDAARDSWVRALEFLSRELADRI